MGQKVNPNGMRIGINKTWNSFWYADKKNLAKNIANKHQCQVIITNDTLSNSVDTSFINMADEFAGFSALSPSELIAVKQEITELLTVYVKFEATEIFLAAIFGGVLSGIGSEHYSEIALKNLCDKGMIIVNEDEIARIKNESVVIIRAHGCSPDILRERNSRYLSA